MEYEFGVEDDTLTGLFAGEDDESWCFNYSECTFKYVTICSHQLALSKVCSMQ